MEYEVVCVAGTFDGLHRGHQTLLSAAFAQGAHVIIALTSDAFVRAFKGKDVASFDVRKHALTQWLQNQGCANRAEIISIDDAIGPAVTLSFDALIVTTQNRHAGEQINILRREQKQPEVALIDVPLVPAFDNTPISSTRIRSGEIDMAGQLVMPSALRKELAIPLGTLLSDATSIATSVHMHTGDVIISVGDQTTKTLIDLGVHPALVVIDNKVNRVEFGELTSWLIEHTNQVKRFQRGPGFIHHDVLTALKIWKQDGYKSLILEIDGEEDLLTLPVLLQAPQQAVLYYGQPGEGVVEVAVTSDIQKKARELLEKFIIK